MSNSKAKLIPACAGMTIALSMFITAAYAFESGGHLKAQATAADFPADSLFTDFSDDPAPYCAELKFAKVDGSFPKLRKQLAAFDLIILDESFAALDPENLERALRCVLDRAPTLMVIAHP